MPASHSFRAYPEVRKAGGSTDVAEVALNDSGLSDGQACHARQYLEIGEGLVLRTWVIRQYEPHGADAKDLGADGGIKDDAPGHVLCNYS